MKPRKQTAALIDTTTGTPVSKLPARLRMEWLGNGRTLTERERLEDREAQLVATIGRLAVELGSVRERIAGCGAAAA